MTKGNGGQKTEDRGQRGRTVDSGRWSVVRGLIMAAKNNYF